ncbi:hypothetical protein DPMN_061302 [Dreissena polymorpha]|uniref:Uncharacterized protein n=1 Tax=Dreissena polymorpha TaxID=45954 RepID=A0A9D4C6R7_DREPO|nr:hypothetical protein DPMN_061302 [Dreissena polymorpha]
MKVPVPTSLLTGFEPCRDLALAQKFMDCCFLRKSRGSTPASSSSSTPGVQFRALRAILRALC